MEKDIRIATGEITEELLKLNVGDFVKFPSETYNPNTLRSMPSQLKRDRARGWLFVTKEYPRERFVIVARFPNEWEDEDTDKPKGDTP